MPLLSEGLTPYVAFIVMTIGSWVILTAFAGRPRSGEDRLRRLIDPVGARGAAEAAQAKRQEAIQARVVSAAGKLGNSLRPTDEEELGKLRLKLMRAGIRADQAVAIYYGLKLLGGLFALGFVVPPLVMRYGLETNTYVFAAAAGGIGFYAPDFMIGRRSKQRAESIFMSLPDALDLMVVCVEAGLGLDAAMRRVTSELGQSSPVLC